MNAETSDSSASYCHPLTRKGDTFIELEGADSRGFDLTPLEDMKSFLMRCYSVFTGDVAMHSRTYRIPVFIPKNEKGVCYCLVDASGVPINQNISEKCDIAWFPQYVKWMRNRLEFSEGLARDQASYIETEFLPPLLSEVSPSGREEIPTIPWESVSARRRCVVLGAPGTGKTTLLRRLALEFCRDASESAENATIPVYLQLRDWADEDIAEDVLSTMWNPPLGGVPALAFGQLYKHGRLILLLDGLDEVPDDKRHKVTELLLKLARERPQLGIILATRTATYAGEFSNFSHFLLRPFGDSQMHEWSYKKLYTQDRAVWLRFTSHLYQVPRLKEVARNPFLLGLMVHFYRQNSILPKDTSTLLASYVRALSGEWDMVRGINRSNESWAAPGKKLSALCRLAFSLVETKHATFTTEEFCRAEQKLVEHSVAEALLPTLAQHTGILSRVSRDVDRWQFTHQILMEFLAAYYLVERADDASALLAKRFKSPVWSDVWVYACGLAQDAGPLLAAVLQDDDDSDIERASLIARALGQSLNISKVEVKAAWKFVLRTVNKRLTAFEKIENKDDHDDRYVLWSMTLRRSEKEPKPSKDIESIEALLKLAYEARGGALAYSFKSADISKYSAIMKDFLKSLMFDGNFEVQSSPTSNEILLAVTRFKANPTGKV